MAEHGTATMAYNAAMGLALIEEMRRDESIFVLGQVLRPAAGSALKKVSRTNSVAIA